MRVGTAAFPLYRMAVIVIAVVFAIALWLMLERTRLGAMIRAGVDDPQMARVVGIRVSQLFTIVFALGAGLAGFAGMIGGPILSVYPGLDQDMLPLALVVVILGGTGSLLGSFVGSIIVGFIYNFGQALLPELAYFMLFLPMVLVLVLRPQGLFGRAGAVTAPPLAIAVAVAGAGRRAAMRSPRPITSTSRARSCSTPSSRSASTCWSVTAAWCRSAMPGFSASRLCGRFAARRRLRPYRRRSWPRSCVGLRVTAVFAALALRATGIGFIMITLALGQILWGLAYRWISITNGDNGITSRRGRRRSALR